MADQKSSTEINEGVGFRHNVDIGMFYASLEKAAIEDSAADGVLYNIPNYTRKIIENFLFIREHCRQSDLPLYRPVDIADALISGDITINPLQSQVNELP